LDDEARLVATAAVESRGITSSVTTGVESEGLMAAADAESRGITSSVMMGVEGEGLATDVTNIFPSEVFLPPTLTKRIPTTTTAASDASRAYDLERVRFLMIV
jgi:hypothetical protein